MFDTSMRAPAGELPVSNAELEHFRTRLGTTLSEAADVSDDDRATQLLARIRLTEELKAALAADGARSVATFTELRRTVSKAQITATTVPGVGPRRRLAEAERGIVSDVAVARRQSPAQASHFMAFAQTAPVQLPQAFAALAAGAVSEQRLLLLHRTTAWLAPEHRLTLDAELAPRLPEWGDRQVVKQAATAAYRLDPAGACAQVAAAENQRHVSLRPAPESMTWFSALLPMKQGVAVWAALHRAGQSAKAAGDQRGRGQVMADTLVERVTGQTTAAAVPIAVELVMTDRALLGHGGGRDEPARIVGHGPVPAGIAREWILDSIDGHTDADGIDATDDIDGIDGIDGQAEADADSLTDADTGRPAGSVGVATNGTDSAAARSIRRLFTDRAGRLVAMETTARRFTPAMARYIRLRDDTCRTAWCDAPIAHIDHITPAATGGATSIDNGRGLCARCNLAAQAPGARSRTTRSSDGTRTVIGLTPAGQTYLSRPADLPRTPPPPEWPTRIRPPRPRPANGRPVLDLIWEPGHRHCAA